MWRKIRCDGESWKNFGFWGEVNKALVHVALGFDKCFFTLKLNGSWGWISAFWGRIGECGSDLGDLCGTATVVVTHPDRRHGINFCSGMCAASPLRQASRSSPLPLPGFPASEASVHGIVFPRSNPWHFVSSLLFLGGSHLTFVSVFFADLHCSRGATRAREVVFCFSFLHFWKSGLCGPSTRNKRPCGPRNSNIGPRPGPSPRCRRPRRPVWVWQQLVCVSVTPARTVMF